MYCRLRYCLFSFVFFPACFVFSVRVGHEVTPPTTQFMSPILATASAVNDKTIDIHVSVTINTTSTPLSITSSNNAVSSSSLAAHPALLYPVPSLSGGACTLADLKKQRSLFRVTGVYEPTGRDELSSVRSLKRDVSNPFIFPASGATAAELTVSANHSTINGQSSSPSSNTWSSTSKRGINYFENN